MHNLLKWICFIMLISSAKTIRCKSWEMNELSAEDIEICMIKFCGCADFRVKQCPEVANYVDVISLVCTVRKIDGLYCNNQYVVPIIDGWSSYHVNAYYETQIFRNKGFISARMATNIRSSNNTEHVGAKLAVYANTMRLFPHKIDAKAMIWGHISAHYFQTTKTDEAIVFSSIYYQITYKRQNIKPVRRGEVKQTIEETIIVGPIGQFERKHLYFHLPHYFNATIYEEIQILMSAVHIDSDGTVRPHTHYGSHYFVLIDLYYMTCFGRKVDEEYTNQTIYSSDGCKPYLIFNRNASNDKRYLNSNFKYECICEQSNHTKPDNVDRTRKISHETELDVAFALAYSLFMVIIISVVFVTILIAIVYYIPKLNNFLKRFR